ncbi:unnamed protein product [Victoria cruziana]
MENNLLKERMQKSMQDENDSTPSNRSGNTALVLYQPVICLLTRYQEHLAGASLAVLLKEHEALTRAGTAYASGIGLGWGFSSICL